MTKTDQLRAILAEPGAEVMPGVFDAMSARLVERAGFRASFMSGFAVAAARLAMPDTGLISYTEMANQGQNMCDAVSMPIIGDGDTGYGNAINTQRTVRLFEASGATAIQLEDQTFPKRCGHLKGKSLVPAGEMVGKIKAAADARRSDEFLIIGRTDAIAVEGYESALDRAERYVEAGADILFIEAPESEDQQRDMCARFKGRVPLLANMVEGGSTPVTDAQALQDLGYSIVIFPGGLFRAYSLLAGEYFASLKKHGSTNAFRNRMYDFTQINELLETENILNNAAQYDAANFE